MIPESPRWLVIHGQMEQALGVIHKVHTSSTLPTGIHASTAEVEAELMELWSAVENDRVAAASQQLHMHSPTKMHQQPPQHRPTGGSPANGWPAKYRETSGNGASGGTGGPGGCGAGLPPAPRPPHARTASRGNGLDLNRAGSSASEGGGFVNEGEVLGIPAQLTRIRTRSSELMYELGEDELKAVLGPDRAHSSGVDSHHSDSPLPPYSSLDLAGDPEVGGGHTQNMARLQQETVLGFWGTAWQMIKDIGTVARGPESAAFRMALVLAFFNQAFASTAIVNYAPAVLLHAGVESGATAALFTSLIGVSKLVGVTIAFFLVDSLGRRQLLVWGSVGCTASLGLLVPADLLDSHWMLVLGMCAFILSFSLSWAGVFWVLLSEMFSMAAKSPAAAAATAALFLTGAGADLLFLTIHNAMGAFAFLVYAAIAAAAAVYVLAAVPETKGRTLKEVQDLLRGPQRCDGRASLIGTEKEVLVPAGAFQSSSALELRQL